MREYRKLGKVEKWKTGTSCGLNLVLLLRFSRYSGFSHLSLCFIFSRFSHLPRINQHVPLPFSRSPIAMATVEEIAL
jgi:hypothetical protein